MEWNKNTLFLSDDEIKKLSIYLAYGTGIGIFFGMFAGNVSFYFSLGGVASVIISLIVCFIERRHKAIK